MKNIKFALILTILLISATCSRAQKTESADNIYGDWTGSSLCADKEKFPACKDEKIIFRFSKSATDANLVHLAGYKIVNGEEDLMGEYDLTYDAENNSLSAEAKINQNLTLLLEFKINGDTMDGTLKKLPEKILSRKITITKKK